MAPTRTLLARPRHSSARRPVAPTVVVLVGVLSLALTARLVNLRTAYELFVDEVTYALIARNVAEGAGVLLHGEAFHLHPAGYFGVLAAFMRSAGLVEAPTGELVYDLRVVPAVIGAFTAPLAALLVLRVTGSTWAGLAAGLLLALDPFLLRFDSRVLLEAQAMALSVLAVLLLHRAVRRQAQERPAAAAAVLAGVVAAGAVLTKETYTFVAVLPVVVLLLMGWVTTRRLSATVLATTVATYAAYVAVVAAVGQLPNWFGQKTLGVRRLLGLVQETGFNRPDGPSFLDRLVANAADVGVTYALLGAGGLASVLLAWRLVRRRLPTTVADRDVLLLLVWVGCADLHLGYALTVGTLEEQMFYLLLVTNIVVLAVAGHVLAAGRRHHDGSRVVASVLAATVAAVLVLDASVWYRVRTTPDVGYRGLMQWAEGLPPGTRLATTEETLQFLLDDVYVRRLDTGREVVDFEADYLLTVDELIAQGYSPVDDDLLRLAAEAPVVYRIDSRTLGELSVHDLSRPRLDP